MISWTRLLLVLFCLSACVVASDALAAAAPAPVMGAAEPAAIDAPSEARTWALWAVAPVGALLALVVAFFFYKQIMKEDEGTDTMKTIASHVRAGANAYLRQQYKVVGIVVIILFAIFLAMAFMETQSLWMPPAFLAGALFSGLCGFLGMRTATNASARTANAARTSLNGALQVSFHAGAVMGLVVVGFALLNICAWFALMYFFGVKGDQITLTAMTVALLSSGMGASTQALFARVGGGIFTKAADVGADLVGKVEAGIPEDDPRNPATIADNVGDNVGDVAGMGADLFESYANSILAAGVLGVAAAVALGGGALTFKLLMLPMTLAGLGCIASVIGVFMVRTSEDATQKTLLRALMRGEMTSAVIFGAAALGVVLLTFAGVDSPDAFSPWGLWLAVITGLVAGVVIGKATEYYTSADYKPTQALANESKTGPATVIIAGLAGGMQSTCLPVITIVVGIIASFGFAGGFIHPTLGLYGVAIAAVGMLSTLGMMLATDAYGPIADNAGGNAEMAGLEPEVRERTDALDSLGNTTAAVGKGFAIGSAALTALALVAALMIGVKDALAQLPADALPAGIGDPASASLTNLVNAYNIHLMNPRVLAGMFIGAMLAFLFCSFTMKAVGRAAADMVEEVRRQFRELGILEGKGEPDYAACVEISTLGAQRAMMVPSLLAIVAPVLVGLILGIAGLTGMLVAALATGFVLAVMMANAGGAWDNAKKYIETGALGGKGSDCHKAAIVGDTVGDPFKDTSGPSLNILIKLMSMVAVVFAGLIVKFSPIIARWLGME